MSYDPSKLPDPEVVERACRPGENLMCWDWDDSFIQAAYNRAVAERSLEEARKKAAEEEARKEVVAAIKEKFPVGSYCQALYSGDGCYYEGKVLSLNNYTCMVEFVGYKNREEVEFKNLKPSKGKKTRKIQIRVAKQTYAMNLTYAAEGQGASNAAPYEPYEYPTTSGASESNVAYPADNYAPPEIPQNMAYAYPPEPPMPPCSIMNNPSVSAMLMSWYMAGYYTGVHQNQKGNSCSAKPHCHDHY